jgi:hypothetical protein
VEGNFGFKVTGSRSKVASTRFFRTTHLCPLIHPPTKHQPKFFIRFEDTERKGIIMQFWVKVKGRINANLLRDTPLSTDTSSHRISIKNLHSFRRYRVEGNFGFKVTGSRSKVTSTRFFCTTNLCPLIHQPKFFSRLGIIEWMADMARKT